MRRLACIILIAGCGTTHYSQNDEGYAQPPPDVTQQVTTSEPPAPAEEIVREKRERPGLATSWGETRLSPVHEVAFHRASDSPFSTGSVFYNDPAGVDAMATYDVRMAARLEAPVPIHGG